MILMYAAQNGHAGIVELLLKYGYGADVDVDAQDDYGWTALMHAVYNWNGRDGVIELLLGHGADVRMKNSNGNDAVNLAIQKTHNHGRIIALLFAK